MQTSVNTTVGALLDGEPIPAHAVRPEPIALPAGQQELLISPGAAFIVDGARLTGPHGRRITQRRNHSRDIAALGAGSPGAAGCRRPRWRG